ncbi:MAG: DUF6125 family protein [Candidatus Bathyarchaeota archaeon]|jgi:hypothetical protein
MSLRDEGDRRMLSEVPVGGLIDLMSLHIRNVWRVDGLYYLGIEERFGTDAATEIDAACWKVMGKIEARALREILGVEEVTPSSFIRLLRHTSWALDIWGKEWEIYGDSVVFRVIDCGTQNTRVKKGLDIFPCRKVRYGYLEAFAKELAPDINMTCRVCPPGKRPEGVWCEWEFRFRGKD